MISNIKTNRGHSKSDNVFTIEYSIKDNNLICIFDTDISNYRTKIINIEANSDKSIYTDEEHEDSNDFIMECSRLKHTCNYNFANSVATPEDDIEYIKEIIDELCDKWDLTHTVAD